MSKNTLLLFAVLAGLFFQPSAKLFAQSKSTTYTITGQVENPGENGEVSLSLFDPVTQAKTPLAKAPVSKEGKYTLEFPFAGADLFRVDFPGRQNVMLTIDAGQKRIELNVEGKSNGAVEIKGSPDSEKLLAYDRFRQASNERLIRPTYEAMRAAAEEEGANPQEEIKAVEAYVEASELHRKELLDFTAENIGTSIALYGTMLRWTGDDEVARLEKLVNDFKSAHPDLEMTGVMLEKVARYKKVALGVKAPEIAEADTAGQVISLYAAKGKVTLLDFWASWCGPCLRQIPDLKEAYAAYHDRGFEIFGISVDTNGDRWKKAIMKYDMTWPNVSNLKGWESDAAAAYNVTFVPFNLLIDENGTILAKNLHSKALQVKLAELLGER